MNRRTFIRNSTSTTAFAIGAATAAADDEEEDREYSEVDDLGNPIEDEPSVTTARSQIRTAEVPTNPTDPPDATIEASQFEWIDVQPDAFGPDETGLRLTDDGGVDFNFLYETEGDLTVDTIWRHNSGGSLAYLFNDLDSTRTGFRAFTNGIAGNGLFFRNPFGGSDISVSGNFQDGQWYQIRIVLDAEENTYTVFINDEAVGQSFYDGSGFVTSEDFRIMGRKTGSSTLIDYRYFTWANRAVLPGDASRVESELLQLELAEGDGDTLGNEGSDSLEPLVDDKRAIIDDIRNTVPPEYLIPGQRVDERASEFTIETRQRLDEFDAEQRDQHIEAFERLTSAEQITQQATEDPVSEIIPDVASNIIDAVASVALGNVRSVASGLRGKAKRSLGKRVGRRGEAVRDTAANERELAPAQREEFTREAARREGEYADAFEAAVEEDQETDSLKEVTDEIVESSIRDLVSNDSLREEFDDRLPDDFTSTVRDISTRFLNAIEGVFFQSYYFASEPTSFDIDPPTVDLPDSVGFSVDIPDSIAALPRAPDEVSVEVETPSALDDAVERFNDGVAAVTSIAEDLGAANEARGAVDSTTEIGTDRLVDQVEDGALAEQDTDERADISDTCQSAISGTTSVVSLVLSTINVFTAAVTAVTITLVILAVATVLVFFGRTILTLTATLLASNYLASVGGIIAKLGAIELILLGVSFATVGAYLSIVTKTHFVGAGTILTTDLGGETT